MILLGCLIVFISTIYPPYFKPLKTHQTKVFTKEQFDALENKGLTLEQIVNISKGQYPADITARIDTGEPLTDENIQKIDMVDNARAELNRRTGDKRSLIFWGGLKILLVAYILYLIPIRFSIWAIRTLKQKE